MSVFLNCRRLVVGVVVLWSAAGLSANEAFDPPALYLTWQRDPTSTMTVHWHTVEEAKPELFVRPRGSAEKWRAVSGKSQALPGSERTVHTAEISGLQPRTDYEFCFWPGEKAFYFRTAPRDLSQPLRFVTGGDVYHERGWMDTMNALAGKLDPAFVVIGGDLAYSCEKASKPENMERWDHYFESWKKHARTADGRLVPLVVTIGNHEVPGAYNQPPERAAVYYTLFSMPGPRGYNVLDFGNYLSLFLLDSGITHPVEGAQTDWLRSALAQRRQAPHLVPVYHIPAYPCVRSDQEGESAVITQLIRKHWCPLFDEFGVKVAFENHDHAFKRTRPIRGNKPDPNGVVYLGDGAWGVNLRKPDRAHARWYLQRADSIRHLYLVTLSPEARQILAFDEQGRVFDEVYQRVTAADSAAEPRAETPAGS